MRISDWSSDVCSSDLALAREAQHRKLMTWADYAGNFRRLLHDSSYPVSDFGATYYLVDHTISYPKNTGIQRVVRSLAAALLRQGVCLIPAKWNQDKTALLPPTELERSEEHTSELQSLMRISYAVFCLKKKKKANQDIKNTNIQYN